LRWKWEAFFSGLVNSIPWMGHFLLRHVTLPKEIAQWIPHGGTLVDDEWRALGVKQSYGWVHYMIHGM
jgi:Cyclin-dependent kinase regulatory subunit